MGMLPTGFNPKGDNGGVAGSGYGGGVAVGSGVDLSSIIRGLAGTGLLGLGWLAIEDHNAGGSSDGSGATGSSSGAAAKPPNDDDEKYTRWKVGEDYSKPGKNGKPPSMSTMRKRFWNEAAEREAASQYGSKNVDRMKRGSAPQRKNEVTGKMDSMELSHDPIPCRSGGMLLTPRWPEEHALIDPFRHLGGGCR